MAAAGAVSSAAGAVVGAVLPPDDLPACGSSALVAMDNVSLCRDLFSDTALDTNSQPETPTAHTHRPRTM